MLPVILCLIFYHFYYFFVYFFLLQFYHQPRITLPELRAVKDKEIASLKAKMALLEALGKATGDGDQEKRSKRRKVDGLIYGTLFAGGGGEGDTLMIEKGGT